MRTEKSLGISKWNGFRWCSEQDKSAFLHPFLKNTYLQRLAGNSERVLIADLYRCVRIAADESVLKRCEVANKFGLFDLMLNSNNHYLGVFPKSLNLARGANGQD